MAFEHQKLLVELLPKLALPLEGQVGGADDEDPLGQASELEFSDQEPGHDRLARPGVVGQEEADTGQLEQIVVDGFKLVRQRVHAGNG